MPCNISKMPLLRHIAVRGYTALAATRSFGEVATIESKVLDNKVVVATARSQLPVSRVAIVFGAGARHETYDNLGASHILRVAGTLSNKNSTGFTLTRNYQQNGVGLTVSSDREIVAYTVESTLDRLECALKFLQDIIHPAFKPWELSDSVPLIKYQVSAVSPQVRAIELLHKAAFHHGLGNSIFIPKFHIGSLSPETMLHYVASNCTAGRCAVVGVGVEQNTLVGFAQSLELNSGGDGKPGAGTYHGGDARKDTPGNTTHVAIAGEGAGMANPNEALAFAVLQYALGAGSCTKRGNVNGGLGSAVTSAVGDAGFSFTTLNATYSDNGLFGFLLSTDAQKVGKAVDAAVKVLKSGSVDENSVTRGKALLKTAIYEAYGTDRLVLEEMAVQACLTKQIQSADSLISAVDSVTAQDVQTAAKKAGSSKLSVGAVGNLAQVPYASSLA